MQHTKRRPSYRRLQTFFSVSKSIFTQKLSPHFHVDIGIQMHDIGIAMRHHKCEDTPPEKNISHIKITITPIKAGKIQHEIGRPLQQELKFQGFSR
ncbi:hypothetical protein [Methanolacinia paynteri]|uniref:hypothetical protein n=1 Tax=Methanolacinia paynteri TaxID=230356 RepID=UPI00064E881B|nr:hypothetical protein [Methanolacinia paynteri]